MKYYEVFWEGESVGVYFAENAGKAKYIAFRHLIDHCNLTYPPKLPHLRAKRYGK